MVDVVPERHCQEGAENHQLHVAPRQLLHSRLWQVSVMASESAGLSACSESPEQSNKAGGGIHN